MRLEMIRMISTYTLAMTVTDWYFGSCNVLYEALCTTTLIVVIGLGQLCHIKTNDCMCFSHDTTSLHLHDLDQLSLRINVKLYLSLFNLWRPHDWKLRLFFILSRCIRLGIYLETHLGEAESCGGFRYIRLEARQISHVDCLHQHFRDSLLQNFILCRWVELIEHDLEFTHLWQILHLINRIPQARHLLSRCKGRVEAHNYYKVLKSERDLMPRIWNHLYLS